MVTASGVRVIVVVSTRDFARCPVTTRLPTGLWPVVEKPVLEHALTCLADQGIMEVVVCSDKDSLSLAKSVDVSNHLKLTCLKHQLPIGAAGCIRDVISCETGEVLLVFSAALVSPPKIDVLISAHRCGRSDLTMIFNPGFRMDQSAGKPADIFICNSSIFEHICKEGYFDIKEALIPTMLRAGKTVHSVTLAKPVGNFRNRQSYLCAIGNYLKDGPEMDVDLRLFKDSNSRNVWMADNASIHPSVRFYGPVVVMDDAQISKDAIILGPTVIGRNVDIGRGSMVLKSVIWDNAKIGPNCEIQQCLIDYHAEVPRNTIAEDKSIPFKAPGAFEGAVSKAPTAAKNNISRLRTTSRPWLAGINVKVPDWLRVHKAKIIDGLATVVVLIAFLWSYWPGIAELWNMWQRSDEYSSGLLVPFLAIYVLWSRRTDLAKTQIRPCLWGICAFVATEVIRLFGLAFVFSSAENLSVALSIAAIVLLLFGWRLFRKVSTVLLFLCLMLPWPTRVQAAVSLPLQRWATSSAIFCLETIGYEVRQAGNLIHVGDASVAVAEACNGLRMVTAFFVISGLVVLLVKRPLWQKLIILASSLPTALLCNTTRLTITAIAFTLVSGEYWEKVFHDFGGYAMMPLALAIVVLELWILAKLTTPPTEEKTIVITR